MTVPPGRSSTTSISRCCVYHDLPFLVPNMLLFEAIWGRRRL